MFIEELILDGFKSYAQRTVISGFDPEFNAITGLNGSGKSNILDAICFLLGISNLNQVRAGNLQDLVYKQGQAGVTKASVTISFNNQDKAASPVGYECVDRIQVTRQIVIGGRNKYLINGRVAQLAQVQNLFHSVSLNVNNPHFLILQGTITKVLNMKPEQILGMIEEAAGTKMYEVKKEASIRTMRKKETKLQEISELLQSEIVPKLESLRQQMSDYKEWSSSNAEFEKLERFCLAYDFVRGLEAAENKEQALHQQEQLLEAMKAQIQEMNMDMKEYESEIEEQKKQKNKEKEQQVLSQESQVGKLSKKLVKVSSQYQHQEETVKEEAANYKSLQKEVAKMEKQMSKAGAKLEQFLGEMEATQLAKQNAEEELEGLRIQHESVSAGIAGGDGAKTLTQTIMDVKQSISQHQSDLQKMEMKVQHLEVELQHKKRNFDKARAEMSKWEKDIAEKESRLQDIESQLHGDGFDGASMAELQQERLEVQRRISVLREQVDSLSGRLARLSFEYQDPQRGFDRSQVKGLVARLLRVQDEEAATALEVVAGGKLYQVVVSSESVGKALLEKGRLQRRVTIIPLNKIRGSTLSDEVMQRARELVGEENAHLAIDLVGFDAEVESAMKYVFGKTIVCRDMESAKRVAFDKQIRTRTVTLDGEIFDPRGTLTGGSMPSSGSMLLKLRELQAAEQELALEEQRLDDINQKISQMEKVNKQQGGLVQERERMVHALELLRNRVKNSSSAQTLEDYEGTKQELAQLREQQEAGHREVASLEMKLEELEDEVQNFAAHRGTKLATIEKSIDSCKAKVQKLTGEYKNKATEVEKLRMEGDQLAEELQGAGERMTECERSLAAEEHKLQLLQEKLSLYQAEFDTQQGTLDGLRQEVNSSNRRLNELQKLYNETEEEVTALKLELKKKTHRIANLQKEAKEANTAVVSLQRRHPWIEGEREFFGRPGTDYDFQARDPREAQRRMSKARETQQKLGKTVNKRVLAMYEKAEQEYEDLMEKKRTVEHDKEKIESTICELDEKKKEVVLTTFEKVNRDFGSIFSTLLPGTRACLEPAEEGNVFAGVEVRVAFGDTWKESLTELSGGQRSLLALSLILSFLLFKPAPVYILDEVDAALDLSHTQNIGRMLKNHFKNSQFLVVSLKEGMFNNANVIFRTKFVNGQSTVTRTLGESSSR